MGVPSTKIIWEQSMIRIGAKGGVEYFAQSYYRGKKKLRFKRTGFLKQKKPKMKFGKDQKQIQKNQKNGFQAESWTFWEISE